ncbi:helix-turn-helix domain-containing protein [Ralstonia chuxiongensis]|uniref:Helix-turn-helix domain-containing protein n=1 Tax=Ralstonia chuxiongensis TaxID=2957504 RepID=A0AA41WVD6_9RALS|nr:helix-turn-helix domain-containing protein [Ralstonia chuxiongensis]MCP1175863.1 helix-turn-helix domain-containing protein [Ralstonia chuxiongensis]
MSIAQHLVAGEDVTYPRETEKRARTTSSPLPQLSPQKRRNLPNRILRAYDAAKHLTGLPRSVRSTLAELCRFVPQNEPFAPIFAHKDVIAERIGADERTVYRHLATLRQLELIEVLPQERKSRSGRFAVARLRLTRKACELVGLIDTNDDVIHTPPHDKMSDRHTLTEPTISKNQRSALVGALPKDLAWLTGQGLSRAGIFKLMGQAKQHGKRLSDIVTVVATYLRDLKGGKLFAYLSALACGPTDFAVPAANERQRQQDAAEAQRVKQRAKLFRQRFAGTTLTNRAQTKLYVIDAQARFVEVVQAGYSATGPLTETEPWIARLRSGDLRLATAEVERAFGRLSPLAALSLN